MKLETIVVTFISASFIFITSAHAYLDPGTGSIIFQAAIALFLGAAATGRLWWSKLKEFFARKDKNE